MPKNHRPNNMREKLTQLVHEFLIDQNINRSVKDINKLVRNIMNIYKETRFKEEL